MCCLADEPGVGGGVRREEGGRKEERDIKRQAAGLIAFKAVWMMYGAVGAPANTHQHVQTTKIVKDEGGGRGGGSVFVNIKSGGKTWEKLATI